MRTDVELESAASQLESAPPRTDTRTYGLASPPARRAGRRDFHMRRLLALADCAGIALALLVAAAVDPDSGTNLDVFAWGLLTLPLWIVVFKLYGLYDRDLKRVTYSTVDDLPWLFHAVVIGALLMWLGFTALPPGRLPLASIAGFGVSALVVISGARSFVREMSFHLLPPERVLLVGEGRMMQVLVRKMRTHPEYGLDPVGALVSNGAPAVPDLPVLGRPSSACRVAEQHRIDRLVLSRTGLAEEELLGVVRRSKDLAIKVSLLGEVVDALGPSVEVDDVEGVTLLGINPPVLPRTSRYLKRCLDLLGAVIVMVLALPLFALIAIAIKVDSRGPVFFKQSRVGKGGRRFQLVKFRTMQRDADRLTAELRAQSKDPNWLHLEHDPRITRVGRLVRLTSLDELPQVWNVLKGEMSLVGPRPLIESEDSMIDGWARSRLDLTPGITGSWQVLGRTNIPFEEMVKLDYLYATNWSLWTDVRLILRTLPVVITRRGAN